MGKCARLNFLCFSCCISCVSDLVVYILAGIQPVLSLYDTYWEGRSCFTLFYADNVCFC